MKHRQSPRKKIIYVFLLILALLALLFYPLASLVRVYAVPFYANTFYMKSVSSTFDSSFLQLNKQLEYIGFNFSKTEANCYNGVSDGANSWFHYFGETVPCMKRFYTQPTVINKTFNDRWNSKAAIINATFIKNGWTEYNDHGRKLAGLYATFDPYSSQITYTKTFGKSKCDLTFEYANYNGEPSDPNNSKAYARETCTRNVSFFGGYID